MHDKKKLLAADDNPDNLQNFRDILEDEYSIVTTTNGLDTIHAAVLFRPDIILLDVTMPGVNGLETCKKLRSLRTLKSSHIILVSARAMPYEQKAGMCAGADVYVTKPFDEIELRSTIRRLLARTYAGSDVVQLATANRKACPGERTPEAVPL